MERRKPTIKYIKPDFSKPLRSQLQSSNQKSLKPPVKKKESFFSEDIEIEWTTDDPFKLGMAYLKNKNYESALTSLRKNQEREPDCLITRYGIGLSLFNLGKFNDAIIEFKQLLLREPGNPEARLNLASAYLKIEKYEQGIKEYYTILEQNNSEENRKKLANAYFLLADKQQTGKDYHEAISNYLKSSEYDKNNGQTFLKLGFCYKELNNIPKASEYLENAMKHCRDRQQKLECFYLLAELKISNGEEDEALKICREGSLIFPHDAKLNYLSGEIYFYKKEYEKALKKYTDAIKAQPDLIQVLINIGQIYVFKNDLDKALSFYFKVLNIDPNNLVALCNISIIKYKEGEKDLAYEQLIELAKFRDSNYLVYKYLGIILLERGKTEEAMDYFRKSIKLNPHDPDNYTNLGVCYHRLKDHENAVIEYNKAIKLAPDELIPLKNLALLYYNSKKYLQSLELYEKVLELEPDNRQAFKNKAHCLKNTEDYETAIKMYKYYLKKNGFDSEVLLNLGITYFEMGHTGDAKEIFKKLTKSDNYAASASFCYLSKIVEASGDLKRAFEFARNSVFLNVYNVEGYIQYARIYILMKKPDKAIICLKRAIEFEPDNEIAKEILDELAETEEKERVVYDEEELISEETPVFEDAGELAESDFEVDFEESEEPYEKLISKEIPKEKTDIPPSPLKKEETEEPVMPKDKPIIVKTIGDLKVSEIFLKKNLLREERPVANQNKTEEKLPEKVEKIVNPEEKIEDKENVIKEKEPEEKHEELKGYIPLVVEENPDNYILSEDDIPMLSDLEDEDLDAIEAIRNFESDLNS